MDKVADEVSACKEVGLAAVAQHGSLLRVVTKELASELSELANYWDSDVQTVAHAEINPIFIELRLGSERQGHPAEVVCLDRAGSEVARCLLLEVKSVLRLYVFLSSELHVPVVQLRFSFPGGNVVSRIGATWHSFAALDTGMLLTGMLLSQLSALSCPSSSGGLMTRDELGGHPPSLTNVANHVFCAHMLVFD